MTINPGPSYSEWLNVLSHAKTASFDELQRIAQRIAESTETSHLTEGQRAELLGKLGDLQVAAAHRTNPFISA